MSVDTKQIAKLVKRRHPLYDSLKSHWAFLEDTYSGGRAWFENNIFRYHKEGDSEYRDRVCRAYRFNHTREVVDLVDKYLFRAEAHRNYEDAPKSVQEFWKNTDGMGRSINEFAKAISKASSIYGRPWLVVDNRVTQSDGVVSLADERSGSIYAYIVPPQDVLDYSWGEDGRLNWVLLREHVRDDGDPFESTGVVTSAFRLWTRTEWFLFHTNDKEPNTFLHTSHIELTPSNYSIRASGRHDLGEVPVIPCDNAVTDNKWAAPALINDIAYLDRAVANYLSNLDAIIQDQTFSQMAMPAQNVLPGDEAYDKILELGTKRIFLYDGEGGRGPEFLSPDPSQAQLILSAIQQIINEIYHSVGLAGERTKQDNAKGIDNSSGVAKSKDFERVNALLISKSDSLEYVENRLARIVALWSGQEIGEDDLVEYPDSFDVRGLYDEFDIAMQLALIDAPSLMRSEQLKRVSDKLFPVLPKALKESIRGEIEQWYSDLEDRRKLGMEGLQQQAQMEGQLLEEAKRNRDLAGSKQSATKSRQTKDAQTKEGQETDRENE